MSTSVNIRNHQDPWSAIERQMETSTELKAPVKSWAYHCVLDGSSRLFPCYYGDIMALPVNKIMVYVMRAKNKGLSTLSVVVYFLTRPTPSGQWGCLSLPPMRGDSSDMQILQAVGAFLATTGEEPWRVAKEDVPVVAPTPVTGLESGIVPVPPQSDFSMTWVSTHYPQQSEATKAVLEAPGGITTEATALQERTLAVLKHVTYPGMTFVATVKSGTTVLLFAHFKAPDSDTGEVRSWKSRKYYISEHMLDVEIVQTAFLCLKTALEHELRESFKYDGVAIFGPHLKLEDMAKLGTETRTHSVEAEAL